MDRLRLHRPGRSILLGMLFFDLLNVMAVMVTLLMMVPALCFAFAFGCKRCPQKTGHNYSSALGSKSCICLHSNLQTRSCPPEAVHRNLYIASRCTESNAKPLPLLLERPLGS